MISEMEFRHALAQVTLITAGEILQVNEEKLKCKKIRREADSIPEYEIYTFSVQQKAPSLVSSDHKTSLIET